MGPVVADTVVCCFLRANLPPYVYPPQNLSAPGCMGFCHNLYRHTPHKQTKHKQIQATVSTPLQASLTTRKK